MKKVILSWREIPVMVFILISGFTSRAQNVLVTIDKTGAPMEDVIQSIENQTTYLFITMEGVDTDIPVTVKVENAALSVALNQMTRGTDVSYKISGRNIVLSKKPQAKPLPVSGLVLDGNGLPVIAAGVLVKGTTVGTTTDADGRFSFTVPAEYADGNGRTLCPKQYVQLGCPQA